MSVFRQKRQNVKIKRIEKFIFKLSFQRLNFFSKFLFKKRLILLQQLENCEKGTSKYSVKALQKKGKKFNEAEEQFMLREEREDSRKLQLCRFMRLSQSFMKRENPVVQKQPHQRSLQIRNVELSIVEQINIFFSITRMSPQFYYISITLI